MRRSRFAWAAALLMAAGACPSSPLLAQEAAGPPPTEDPIVVTGVRDQQETIHDYVGGITVARQDQPLPRYIPDEYCPAVLGLSAQRNAQIAGRMRAVAAAAGVKPAAAGCVPSALVIFVDDKEAFLRDFRARHPTYFIDLQGRNPPAPAADGPAVAWHLVQLLDPQGVPLDHAVGGGYNVVESPAGGSRLLSMVRPVVAMSVVVVERGALVGLTGTQIADYALMRTLTDRGPEGLDVPAGLTILGAIGAPMGGAVPLSLTEWDLAYLKGRYAGHPARYGQSQAAAIRNRIRRALAGAGEE